MAGSFLFRFEPHVPLAHAEMSLHLAMFAVEGLAGRARVRLDATYQINAESHVIRIDGSTRVGQMIARVFAGLLLREFGEDAFCVEHVTKQPHPKPEEVHV
ncbi:MAG: hypothetical protein KatS3mg082_2752 [Nitrospiraceae bacterium]|nr:MAG: hypothetical protein KatS3mg082_2695 [Nitrospiraceae bacterium]GIW56348.1 MAG: hypothetical protein KatS3mg082_2752 [Nitrospiraceae bacterium]